MEIEERESGDCASATEPLRISDIDIKFEYERRRALVKYIIRGWENRVDPEIRDREDMVVW
jgi:hypothetical protein